MIVYHALYIVLVILLGIMAKREGSHVIWTVLFVISILPFALLYFALSTRND